MHRYPRFRPTLKRDYIRPRHYSCCSFWGSGVFVDNILTRTLCTKRPCHRYRVALSLLT
nr:MAG TPA: hypothetical protein [Bacteriophage sp.]